MATDSGFFLGSAGGQVPPVDPVDLKSVWVMQDRILAVAPGPATSGQSGVISVNSYEQACGPGANVHAVFLRVSILRALQMLKRTDARSFAWLQDGTPDDAVFRAVAAIPMSGLLPGSTTREGIPFDVEELRRRIEKESEY